MTTRPSTSALDVHRLLDEAFAGVLMTPDLQDLKEEMRANLVARTGEIEADPEHAKFAIDMLNVIAEKTKGNLSPGEAQGLEDILHQLRMAFVAVTTQSPIAGA